MTSPALPTTVRKLGPGELTIGSVGSVQQVACLVNSITLEPNVSQDDPVTKLCGRKRAGDVEITWALSGNVDIDIASQTGLFHLALTAAGSLQPYEFKPAADGPTFTGSLTLTPFAIGGGDMGKVMTSDFEWQCDGDPVATWPTP